MTKIKNKIYDLDRISSDTIKYTGEIPDCIVPNCDIDQTNLTYLIFLLLERYCEDNDILETDLSTIDISCLLTSNPDIELPENITVGNLLDFYKNHFCSIYNDIEEIKNNIESLQGIYCLNDVIQLDQNTSINIDPLFNDLLIEVSGTPVLSIIEQPINGNATIINNTISYVPFVDFFGNDQIVYQVTKGTNVCTARISIKVNEIITTETINTLVTDQLITLLTSDEYWDLGIPIGSKMSITESNLVYFNLNGANWGNGIINSRWAKWSICNGNNGTDNESGLTTRGFDKNDLNYNNPSPSNNAGSDALTLNINNIPSHRHTGMAASQEDGSEVISRFSGSILAGGIGDTLRIGRNGACDWGCSGADVGMAEMYYNSGNGTNNINNQDELPITPSALNIVNKYFTEIKIQKIM